MPNCSIRPAIEHHDDVGKLDRFLLIVRHENAGEMQFVMQAPQPAAQFMAHLAVEGAEGLVQQQHVGIDRQRARERDALPLAARQLRGIALSGPVELHQFEQ